MSHIIIIVVKPAGEMRSNVQFNGNKKNTVHLRVLQVAVKVGFGVYDSLSAASTTCEEWGGGGLKKIGSVARETTLIIR